MIEVKAADLIGAPLDWAVAAALEHQYGEGRVVKICRVEATTPAWIERENSPGSAPYFHRFSPSTDHAQGALIIEQEGIDLHQHRDVLSSTYEYSERRWNQLTALGKAVKIVCRPLRIGPTRGIQETKQPGKFHGLWMASYGYPAFGWKSDKHFISPTLLIAAMRCYVAAKLGDVLSVPAELF
jgi:hypothetical protein